MVNGQSGVQILLIKSHWFYEMGDIEKGDNYTIVDSVLSLNKGRMATLAKLKLE